LPREKGSKKTTDKGGIRKFLALCRREKIYWVQSLRGSVLSWKKKNEGGEGTNLEIGPKIVCRRSNRVISTRIIIIAQEDKLFPGRGESRELLICGLGLN